MGRWGDGEMGRGKYCELIRRGSSTSDTGEGSRDVLALAWVGGEVDDGVEGGGLVDDLLDGRGQLRAL